MQKTDKTKYELWKKVGSLCITLLTTFSTIIAIRVAFNSTGSHSISNPYICQSNRSSTIWCCRCRHFYYKLCHTTI